MRLPAFLRLLTGQTYPNHALLTFIDRGYVRVWVLELIPSFALYRGLYEFAQYAFLHGYGVRS